MRRALKSATGWYASVAVAGIALYGQDLTQQRPFYAEQRQEDWLSSGKRIEETIQVTRLPDGSSLVVYTYDGPEWRAGKQYFSLIDRAKSRVWHGDTLTGGAFWQPIDPSEVVNDDLGDCSVLKDDSIRKTEAGQVRKFRVLRAEWTEGKERHMKWIAPQLGCLALRSQILVDEFVRERIETTYLQFLPNDTELTLPAGIRVMAPMQYCEARKKAHRGEELVPSRTCADYQRRYEAAGGANVKD